eukprot:361840-Chlamydomonas_euryale.AAC.3
MQHLEKATEPHPPPNMHCPRPREAPTAPPYAELLGRPANCKSAAHLSADPQIANPLHTSILEFGNLMKDVMHGHRGVPFAFVYAPTHPMYASERPGSVKAGLPIPDGRGAGPKARSPRFSKGGRPPPAHRPRKRKRDRNAGGGASPACAGGGGDDAAARRPAAESKMRRRCRGEERQAFDTACTRDGRFPCLRYHARAAAQFGLRAACTHGATHGAT